MGEHTELANEIAAILKEGSSINIAGKEDEYGPAIEELRAAGWNIGIGPLFVQSDGTKVRAVCMHKDNSSAKTSVKV